MVAKLTLTTFIVASFLTATIFAEDIDTPTSFLVAFKHGRISPNTQCYREMEQVRQVITPVFVRELLGIDEDVEEEMVNHLAVSREMQTKCICKQPWMDYMGCRAQCGSSANSEPIDESTLDGDNNDGEGTMTGDGSDRVRRLRGVSESVAVGFSHACENKCDSPLKIQLHQCNNFCASEMMVIGLKSKTGAPAVDGTQVMVGTKDTIHREIHGSKTVMAFFVAVDELRMSSSGKPNDCYDILSSATYEVVEYTTNKWK